MNTCKIEPVKTIQALYRANKPFKAKPTEEYLKICDDIGADDLKILGDYMNGLMQIAEKYKKPIKIGRFMQSMDDIRYPYIMTNNYVGILNGTKDVPQVVREVYDNIGKDLK